MSIFLFLRRNVLWLGTGVVLTFLSSFGQTFFISVFAGEIRQNFGRSHGQCGGIYSLGTSVSALAMVWAGGLTDRLRVRVLGPVVIFGLAAACIAMATNTSVWLLPVIILALRFFGQGMTSHIAVVAMSRWFVATRGKALSIATLGFSLGEATLPVLFVGLMGLWGWQNLWFLAALLCLTGIPVLLFALRHERTPQSIAASEISTGMQGRHWTRNQMLKHPLFWFMVPALLGPAAFNTAFFFHQVHFAEIKGLTHVGLVAFFPFYTVMAIAAMIASGWALDRFGTARTIPYFLLPMVGAFVSFSLAYDPVVMFAGFFFLAMTTGSNATLPNAFWAEFYGTANIGSIKAMAAAVMVLGSAIGPGVTGLLIDLGVGLEQQFVAIAVYFALATVLMWLGIMRAP